MELGTARIAAKAGTAHRVIAQLHAEMRTNLEADARFRERVRRPAGPEAAPSGDPGAAGPATSREPGQGA